MTASFFAKALGGESISANKVIAPGPGHSPRDRSMSVLLDPAAPHGFYVNSFAGDDWRLCRDHVRARLGATVGWNDGRPASKMPLRGGGSAEVPSRSAFKGAAAAWQIWNETVALQGSVGEAYLLGRGIPSEVHGNSQALRFHPACPFRLSDGAITRLPTLVAMMADVQTNCFRGIHRTALAPDGRSKAIEPRLGNPKRMLGPASGACVKLSADEEVTLGLHIAEGIETTLACMAMGYSPAWAVLSAGGISNFPIPSGIDCLTVFADHDVRGTGLEAARRCARRWCKHGKEAVIAVPRRPGSDFADPLQVGP